MPDVNDQHGEEIDEFFHGIALDAAILMLSINCPYSINRENCPSADLRNMLNLSLKEKQELIKQLPEAEKKKIIYEHLKCVEENRLKYNPANGVLPKPKE